MKLPDLNLILNCHCKKATELASESFERPLTGSERWALRLHTFVCKSCRRAIRQLQQMRSAFTELPERVKQSVGQQKGELSPTAKTRIAEAMKQAEK